MYLSMNAEAVTLFFTEASVITLTVDLSGGYEDRIRT